MTVDVWVMQLDRAAARAKRDEIVAAHPGRPASYSDSGGVAIVALGEQGPVGADVERLRDRAHIDAVAARILEAGEARAVADARGPDRLARFYRAWTAAEASAKARGRGLPAMLGRDAPRLPVTWFEPAPGFVAAIAAEDRPPRLRLSKV